ncbi:hypothetical protein IEN85_12285 [Pelagicoccus sp. NFK12]|uniref:Archaemetzincin n=1 Tax=Pelagicoccus enzymogenes TaxID=2773457 RepID=A0A927F874_9BACT|nr:archaemetzincin [Pelagicoccus enzymogenes]MBD5780272.1 hypothetical protein [Pelagicoccus enzymogenes]
MKRLPLLFCSSFLALAEASEFIPPSNLKCVEALGNIESIPSELRTLFLDTVDIAPIPAPGSNDWLASHRERGQTFPQFKAGNFNVPDKDRPYLYLQPIGEESISDADKELLANYCSDFFNTEVRLMDSLRVDPNRIRSRVNAFTSEPQLNAKDILTVLDLNKPKDAYAIIAFSETDLYPDESWNFVFGMANLQKSVGVFSFARYGDRDKDGTLYLQRALKVMTHEIGHMYGMMHCTYYHCLMNGSNNLSETDRSPMHLCPVCLRKLHEATQPDHIMRYTKLKKTYQSLEFTDAADFARSRVEQLLKAALQ